MGNVPIGASDVNKFTLDIKTLAPTAGPQFSPNLHAWLKKNYGGRLSGWPLEVYRRKDDYNHMYVGYLDDTGSLVGSKLGQILTKGARAQRFSIGGDYALVRGFWRKYAKIGRCAIDPDHRMGYKDERWAENKKKALRKCLWCGLQQKKQKQERVVVEKVWVAA